MASTHTFRSKYIKNIILLLKKKTQNIMNETKLKPLKI